MDATSWLHATYAVLFLLLIIAAHAFRVRSLKRLNARLRATQAELKTAYSRLQGITRRIDAATENERNRISHELHDEMGQVLTATKINLQMIERSAAPEERDHRLHEAIALVDTLIQKVQSLSLDLRPPLLTEIGLAAALRQHLRRQSERSGISMVFLSSEAESRDELPVDAESLNLTPRTASVLMLPSETSIAVFRIVQEAITNVVRHSHATQVSVRFYSRAESLHIEINDNGCGFDVEAVTRAQSAGEGRLGLTGIQERAHFLGGSAAISSSPGGGTSIHVIIPLRSGPSAEEIEPQHLAAAAEPEHSSIRSTAG